VGQQPQVEKIKAGLDILVATPGRLLDLHNQRLLDLSGVEIFVLDEADRMLDMGFIHDVRRVLKVLPQKKQTLFFSATMPPEVMELVDGLLHDPVRVAVDPISSPVEVIDQCVYFVDKGNKTKLLAQLVREQNISSALVFSRTKHGANKIAQDLNKQGLTAAAIHGNKSQSARQQALADFKAGRVRLLVATDIAARGIDIEEMPCVFNYNLPEVPETYVHRIGRTGRAGHEGIAIAFCDGGERDYLKGIEKLIGRSLPVRQSQWAMQGPEDVEVPSEGGQKKENQPAKAAQSKTEARKKRKKPKPALRPEQTKAEPPAPVEEKKAPGSVPKGQPAKREQAKRKFTPPTKTLAEFEAEERAFQERIAKERKERNTVRQMGALAGEVIMDATARLLAPRKKPTAAVQNEQEKKPAAAAPQQKTSNLPKGKGEGKLAKSLREKEIQQGKTGGKGGKQNHKPAKTAQQTPVKMQEQKKQAPAGRKKDRFRRDQGPRPVESRPGRIKDSTEQPSLMKPFYFGPED